MADTTALDSQQLTKCFGALVADDHLSFTVERKEIFGLLGPNGAGKSTLMKMLTTVLPPTSGDALVGNLSITKNPAKVREMIGYVPQLISADGNLTGYENLLMFAKLYNMPRKLRDQRVREALATVDLLDMAHRYVREYSGGMIRRLEIVQAMLHQPKILFLDEPTSGLDPIARKTLWGHLQKLHRDEGLTIILTTHDMQEAEYLCDRVAIMLKGNIIKMGATKELIAELGEDATLDDVFIECVGDSIEAEQAFAEIVRRRRTESRRGS